MGRTAGGAIRGLAFALCISLPALQPADAGPIRDRIYQADKGWPAPPAWTGTPPSPASFRTADGLALSGYYWPGTSGRIILYFHGNAGNQTDAAHYAEPLAGKGDALLIASYRGYGGNPGKPDEAGLFADGRAALAEARRLGFADDHIYLFGYSLGAAVALQLAAETKVGGIVTLGAFTSLAAAAPKGTGWLMPDRYDNIAAITRITSPILLFHSKEDEVIPYASGAKLYAAAHAPKQFGTIRRSPHRTDMNAVAPVVTRAVAAMASGEFASLPPGGPE
jgi:esterase/lipase